MNKKRVTKDLNPNEILVAEFTYAKDSAFQANQDRIALYNYFLSTGGALVAGLVFGKLDNELHRNIFLTVFLGLAIWGLISYLKLLKIRIAWNSSILAMNRIKEFYRVNYKELDLKDAFKWSDKSKPAKGKLWTITFLMGIMFAIVDSFALGIGIYLLSANNIAAVLGSALFFITHGIIWVVVLKE